MWNIIPFEIYIRKTEEDWKWRARAMILTIGSPGDMLFLWDAIDYCFLLFIIKNGEILEEIAIK